MESPRSSEERKALLEEHRAALQRLEAEEAAAHPADWPPGGFYLIWHLVVGITIGGLGALVSLALNLIGAPLFGQPSMQLIRVYLTFPMGERALHAEEGVVLFVGALLYLITGAAYGIVFHLAMRMFRDDSTGKRFLLATAFGLAVWLVNFYLILIWLQPLLLGGNWIVELVPFWVAALTHLAFAWTMLAAEMWGRFEREPLEPQQVNR